MAGYVGAPMPCNYYIKLVDVEDMSYLAAKGEVEAYVKGANMFKGYLKDPARTAEALDKDGWLHTGDIGKWLPVSHHLSSLQMILSGCRGGTCPSCCMHSL